MPHLLCKLGKEQYFFWSTVTDSPLTYAMTLDELKRYYREEYGRQAMRREFGDRVRRVDEKGVSSFTWGSLEELVRSNRAGPNGECLNFADLHTLICSKKPYEGCPSALEIARVLYEDDSDLEHLDELFRTALKVNLEVVEKILFGEFTEKERER